MLSTLVEYITLRRHKVYNLGYTLYTGTLHERSNPQLWVYAYSVDIILQLGV